jgi:hypothetical protein
MSAIDAQQRRSQMRRAGQHRLAAAKKLKWKEIECLVLDGGEDD